MRQGEVGARGGARVRFPPDIVFVNRTFGGHFGNLGRLKAQGASRTILERSVGTA